MQRSTSTQPVGVVILVTLGAVFGVFTFLGGLAVFGFGAFVTTSAGLLGGLFSLVGLLVLVIGILEIVFAYGAWLLRSWAWVVGVPVTIASIAINVLWVLAGASLGFGLIGILAALVILYCMDAPAVRAGLGRSSASVMTGLIRRPTAQTRARGQLIRRPIRSSEDN